MIRKASVADIPMIREMAEVVFRQTYASILSPDQMEYMMDWMYSEDSLRKQMAEQTFFVEDGRGYASLRPDGRTDDGRLRFHLEKLYVLPQFQKTGLGRRLFESAAAEARAIAGGACVLELNVNRNNPSLSFYEHLGMRRARQGDFPIGGGFYMNDYIMSIEL